MSLGTWGDTLAPISNPVAIMGLEALLHRITLLGDQEPLQPTMSLLEFLREAWPILEPTSPLIEGFHVEAICLHLEAVTFGKIRDFLLTIPPRMTKSTIVSVAWPAWEWTFRPQERFLTASYVQDVATQDALRTRDLIQSAWYQERWGHVFRIRGDENRKTRYQNNRGGQRIAIGARGKTTSLGGSRLIIDDPHNVMEAHSFEKREAMIRWFDVAFSNRQNNPLAGARVIVQQRVHDHDLAGHVIRQGGWEHLNLPMEYEDTPQARTPTSIGWVDPRTESGELLVEERMDRQEVEKSKVRMGADYRAQYQQMPSLEGGNIFQATYWRWYRADFPVGTEGGRPPDHELEIVAFADTASKQGEQNAFTVFSVWGRHRPSQQAFLLQVYRSRVSFPQLLLRMGEVWADWHHRGLNLFKVEDKSSGIGLIQMAQNPPKGMPRYPVDAWSPGPGLNDKVFRANQTTGWLSSGAAVLPCFNDGSLSEQPLWVREFVGEHTEFPEGPFADQVDTTSMMIHSWFIDEEDKPRQATIVAPGGSVGPGLITAGGGNYREGLQAYDDSI